jgi:hypothetical protein
MRPRSTLRPLNGLSEVALSFSAASGAGAVMSKVRPSKKRTGSQFSSTPCCTAAWGSTSDGRWIHSSIEILTRLRERRPGDGAPCRQRVEQSSTATDRCC